MELRSPMALIAAMAYNDESVRSLALKCRVHRSVIGHLRTGHRKTCYPYVAKAIEAALNVGPGVLFEFKVNAVRRAA